VNGRFVRGRLGGEETSCLLRRVRWCCCEEWRERAVEHGSRIADIEIGGWPTVDAHASSEEVRRVLADSVRTAVLVLDEAARPRRWVNADHLEQIGSRPLTAVGLPADAVVQPHATLSDTLNEMLVANFSTAIVVDDAGTYQGTVDIDTINEAVRGMRAAERSRLRGRRGAETQGG
jgi:osmoprotectant transport system ATP-binding protein